MLCSPERSRSAVDGRAEGCSVRERSVALAWMRTLLECTSIDNYTGNGIGNVIQTCRAVHVM